MQARRLFDNLMTVLKPVRAHKAMSTLLEWDLYTICPENAKEHRGYIDGLMGAKVHEAFVDPAIGRALKQVQVVSRSLPELEQRLVARFVETYDREICVPTSFVQEQTEAHTECEVAWKKALKAKNFSLCAPQFSAVLDFARREAVYYGADQNDGRSMFQALLQEYEPGLTTDRVEQVLHRVRDWLVPFIRRFDTTRERDRVFKGKFPVDEQLPACRRLLKDIGFDFSAGVVTVSPNAFCLSIGPNDTRVSIEDEPDSVLSIYSAAHEGGHALYAQNDPKRLDWAGPFNYSLGIDEAQAKLYENDVFHSWPACQYLFPRLAADFPKLRSMIAEEFYRSVNIVRPGLKRLEADEVTYNLHILLRVELEIDLLSGKLSVADLPYAFADKQGAYLGLRPHNDAEGVLQDDHWAAGMLTYFFTYTPGNLLGTQKFAAFTRAHPNWEKEFAAGNFKSLLRWLRANVYPLARVMDIDSLAQHATGEPLNPQHWFRYIEEKYSRLYQL